MKWWKVMSVTDALQPTTGNVVPFLRMTLTCGVNPREQLFVGVPGWTRCALGTNYPDGERVDIDFEIIDDGRSLGRHTLEVNHAEKRTDSHMHPATRILWNDHLRDFLENNNRAGWTTVVEERAGRWFIELQPHGDGPGDVPDAD